VIRVLFGLEAVERWVGFSRKQDHEGRADALAAADVDSATCLGHNAL
jgi:hypothetical protein